MVNTLEWSTKLVFLAIQTVFKGYGSNTFDKLVETQKKYALKIPFG
jgi:hypothetical protein